MALAREWASPGTIRRYGPYIVLACIHLVMSNTYIQKSPERHSITRKIKFFFPRRPLYRTTSHNISSPQLIFPSLRRNIPYHPPPHARHRHRRLLANPIKGPGIKHPRIGMPKRTPGIIRIHDPKRCGPQPLLRRPRQIRRPHLDHPFQSREAHEIHQHPGRGGQVLCVP